MQNNSEENLEVFTKQGFQGMPVKGSSRVGASIWLRNMDPNNSPRQATRWLLYKFTQLRPQCWLAGPYHEWRALWWPPPPFPQTQEKEATVCWALIQGQRRSCFQGNPLAAKPWPKVQRKTPNNLCWPFDERHRPKSRGTGNNNGGPWSMDVILPRRASAHRRLSK